jgi:hypothetical protein
VSLYRQPGRVAGRTLALVAAAALVVGLAAGFATGRASRSDPALAEQIGGLRNALAPAREGFELAAPEYAQGVRGGRVVSAPEYGGAQAAVRRAQAVIASRRDDIRALGVQRATALEAAAAALAAAMEQRRDPAEVKRLADTAGAALKATVGP